MKSPLPYMFLFFLVLSACTSEKDRWGYRKQLPPTASEVKEWYTQPDGFLPDYEYYLKARMSPSDFESYRSKLKLNFHTDSVKYTDEMHWLSTSGIYADSIRKWWDFTSKPDSLFVWQQEREWNIARYIDGNMYFYAHHH